MSDAYGWDRSGPVDPELQSWEEELGRFRYRHGGMRKRRRGWRRAVGIAAAAMVVLAAGGGWLVWETRASRLLAVKGRVNLNGQAVNEGARMRAGDVLRTGAGGRAQVRLGSLGRLEIEPESELVLAADGAEKKRVKMGRGRLRAYISAAPYAFRIETVQTLADDMGCAYELNTDGEGRGRLRVTEGWVRLKARGVESLVIEGTEAELLTRSGPGIPLRSEAGEKLRRLAALAEFEAPVSQAALEEAMAEATGDDAVTLLNLLWRLPETRAVRVYERLAGFYPPPAPVSWRRFEQKDWAAVADWWPYLGFRKTVKLPRIFYGD